MPGPTSQSMPDPPTLKESWRKDLAAAGHRYLVLKVADVFAACDEEDVEDLDAILKQVERHRVSEGRPPERAYWVFARHWPRAAEVRRFIERVLGLRAGKLGAPYRVPEEDQ